MKGLKAIIITTSGGKKLEVPIRVREKDAVCAAILHAQGMSGK
jgi:hypothetical protein